MPAAPTAARGTCACAQEAPQILPGRASQSGRGTSPSPNTAVLSSGFPAAPPPPPPGLSNAFLPCLSFGFLCLETLITEPLIIRGLRLVGLEGGSLSSVTGDQQRPGSGKALQYLLADRLI